MLSVSEASTNRNQILTLSEKYFKTATIKYLQQEITNSLDTNDKTKDLSK